MANTKVIFSDAHLCDHSRANDFHHGKLLLRFLDEFDKPDYDVIAAGDIFELLQCCSKRMLYYQADILNKMFAMKNLHILSGNHDWILGKYFPSVYLADGVHVQHGHKYDIYNAKPSRIGFITAKAVGWFEKLIHRDSDKWLQELMKIKGKITPASENYPGSYTEYKEGAREVLRSPTIDVSVMGHTHKAKIYRLKNGIYANAGCWAGPEDPTYIMVTETTVKLYNATTKELLAETDRRGIPG